MEREAGHLISVHRALDVLEAFTAETPEWGLSALSRELDLGKPTLHRVLKTLADRGYLQQDPSTRRYRLGFRLLETSQAVLVSTPTQAAEGHLRELAHRVGQQATLWVLDGDSAVCVLQVEGQQALGTHIRLGAREPALLLASGRCLLAHLPESERLSSIDGAAPNVERDLGKVRARGYAVSRGDRWADVSAVGAPVFDHAGACVAAIAVSAPTSRFDAAAAADATEAVCAAARKTSHALGAPGAERHWTAQAT